MADNCMTDREGEKLKPKVETKTNPDGWRKAERATSFMAVKISPGYVNNYNYAG